MLTWEASIMGSMGKMIKVVLLRWLFNCKIIIPRHICLSEFREIFRKCSCIPRERLVRNCKLLAPLQVTLTWLSPSRPTFGNLRLISWVFTAGNLFLYPCVEWRAVVWADAFRFHGPFIMWKPICLCTSLTKLGKQSSRRNWQLLERQVITKHKASLQQLPYKQFSKYGN